VRTILPSWRLLILDRTDPDDPRWLIVTVTRDTDVLPAQLDAGGRYLNWPAVTQWASARLGEQVELTPVTEPLAWTIRPARRQS
jgi:hypothetical protein